MELKEFVTSRQAITHKKTGTPRYVKGIEKYIQPSNPDSNYIKIHNTYNRPDLITNLSAEITRIGKLTHQKQAKEREALISARIRTRAIAIRKGKLRKPIMSILERPGQHNMGPVVDTQGITHIRPKGAHQVLLDHWTSHFCSPNQYIDATQLNTNTAEGHALRQHILAGTWEDDIDTRHALLDPIPQIQHRNATHLLNQMKIKVNQQVQDEMQRTLYAPITYEEIMFRMKHKLGGTAPGPSGLTLDIIKILPDEWTQALYACMNALWQQRKTPSIWRNRIMALIPKTELALRINEFRPIMLLEVLRKEWLSILRVRAQHTLSKHHILHTAQKGGLPHLGTEDAIMAIINAIEDSHEHQNNLHILSYDKRKAFDSPFRMAGLYMAYRRVGIPDDIAHYLINCDDHTSS